MFEFALGRRAPLGQQGGLYRLQAEVTLNLAHQHFLAPVVVAVARDKSIEPDPICQQVNVFVLGVVVPRNEVLVVVQAHAMQVTLADRTPLVVGEMFARRGLQRDVQHGLPKAGRSLRISPNSAASSRGLVPFMLVSITRPCSLPRSYSSSPRKPLPFTALAIIVRHSDAEQRQT
jgi:hypothetical protein